MAETLFTDIIENLGKTKINITGSGGKSGKEQIQNAPSGITSNKETINIAGSAEIPITNNVDFLLGISALPCRLIVSLSEVMPDGAPTICCLPVLLPDPVTLTFDLPKLLMISVNKVSATSVSVD